MRAAIKSGIPRISEFDALDDYDKAMLVAYWRTVDKMESFEAQQQQGQMERKAKVK